MRVRSEVDFTGKLRVTRDSVIIERRYLEPDTEENLVSLNGEIAKVKLSTRMQQKTVRTYEQLKLWFSVVGDIITFYGEEINPETKKAIHEFLKEKYIPTEYLEIGGKRFPQPKSIADIAEFPKDKFSEILDKIMEDFRMEGCIFRRDTEERYE